MKLVSKLALAAALAVPSFGLAQNDMATTSTAADLNVGALTFTGGVDLASNYYFRGYLQENSGFIVQPYFSVSTTLVDSDDFRLGLLVGTWNSVHSEHTGNDDGGPDAWYENDLFVTAPITLPTNIGDFTIAPGYKIYQYPNGAFDTIHEGYITATYDDTKLWKDVINFTPYDNFSLAPTLTVAYELGDGNGDEEGYYELGIAPKYTFDVGGYKLPITVPITLGGGWDGYYSKSDGGNDFFGYIQGGVETAIPIPESIIPARYGSWSVTGGAYYQNLFSDSAEIANNDSSHVFWGRVGLAFSY